MPAALSFRQDQVPQLVQKLMLAAQRQQLTEPEPVTDDGAETVVSSSETVSPQPQQPVAQPVQISQLMRPSGSPSVLREMADIDQYLELLRRDLLQALDDDQYIMLF